MKFPPIREDYRKFDKWARQFETRRAAERYAKDRARGKEKDKPWRDNFQKLLDYDFGDRRYTDSHHTTKAGREYVQFHAQATHEITISGKKYRAGSFVPLSKSEKDPEFQKTTIKMIEADRAKERAKK